MRIVRLVLCDWGRHLVPPSQATRVIIDGEIVSHICHKCRKREQEGFKISLQELKDPGSEKQITQSVKNEVDLPPIEGGASCFEHRSNGTRRKGFSSRGKPPSRSRRKISAQRLSPSF